MTRGRDVSRCRIHKLRDTENVIVSRGSVPAKYLFVRTHPTEEEEQFNTAFCDQESEVLYEILNALKIDVNDIHFTYVLGCVPRLVIPATKDEPERLSVRKVDLTEVDACMPRLEEVIYSVDPEVIVTFGLTPLQRLTDGGRSIKKTSPEVNNVHTYTLQGRLESIQYPVIPCVDTFLLLKDPSSAKHGPTATTIESLRRAKRYVTWTNKLNQINHRIRKINAKPL